MRKKRLFLAISVIALLAVVQPAEARTAISHYEYGRDLYEMERWADARVELLEAKRQGGMRDKKLSEIDYMLAVCAVEIGMETADRKLVNYGEHYRVSPYHNDVEYRRGLLAMESSDWDLAYEVLQDVDYEALTSPQKEQYNIRMGYIHFCSDENREALEYLKRIEESSELYHHALYYISYIKYEAKRYDEAKVGLLELLDNDMYSPVVPYYLLQIEFDEGNYNGAIEYATELLKSAPKSEQGELVRTIAEAYFRTNDYAQAIKYIDRYVEAGGEMGREECYVKGFSLHQQKKYQAAAELLRRACGADDELTQNASFHLANCYLHLDDKREALKAFSMASNDKFNAEIAEASLYNYAKLQYELDEGHFNETINSLTRYVEKYNTPRRLAVVQTLLAAAYYNSRDYATAYDKIGQIRNPDADIRAAKQKITYLRGLELFNAGEYAESKRYLSESISIGIAAKQLSLAKYWIGEIDFLAGDYNSAMDGYNYLVARAPESDKMSIEAQYSIAYALYKQDKTSSALEYFNRYVAAQTNDDRLRADAYNRIGDIYYSQRRFAEATTNYRRAIECDRRVSNYARYQIAIILGVEDKSSAKAKQLLSIIEDNEGEEYVDKAYYELGTTYIKNGDYTSAISTLERFLDIYPRSELYASALSQLGVAYTNAKDMKGALDYYDRAIKAAPQSQIAKDAMQGVREIYVRQGNADGYFKYAEKIGMEGDLNAVMRDSLSFASARGLYFASEESKSKQRDVVTAIRNYVKGYPNGYYLSDALFYMSDCYIKLGENSSAISTLTTLDARGINQYSERVYRMLAKLTYDDGLYDQSAKASRRLFDVAKSEESRHEAMNGYVRSTQLMDDKQALRAMSDDILALGEKSAGVEATSEAFYVRATDLRERGDRGDRAQALEIYKGLILRPTAKRYHSEARFYVIDDLYQSGNVDDAEKLIFEFAESDAEAYWLAKSFILLGDIYVSKGDTFQARATYQSIVDGYAATEDGIIEQAKGKIEDLK